MRYLSVCSGIEAATVAWHPLGWEPVAYCEIEPFPSAVLKEKYPHVPNYGDFTRLAQPDHPIRSAGVDLLVGGTPCQAFSVAGLRRGLADPRGGLTLEFVRLAQALRPRWIVWENVPGVLSQDGGRAFGAFLGALGELGYGWAYRVLDAQWFGVAQRRRRVFVVACAGADSGRAAAVLFEPESVRRDTPPSREARQGTAGVAVAGAAPGGGERGAGRNGGVDEVYAFQPRIARNGRGDMGDKVNALNAQSGETGKGDAAPCVAHVVAPPLTATNDPSRSPQSAEVTAQVHAVLQAQTIAHVDVVGTLSDGAHNGGGLNGQDAYTGRILPVAFAQNSRDEVRLLNGDGALAGALSAEHGMNQTTYVAQPVVPYDLFQVTAPINRQNRDTTSPCHTLARDNAAHAAVVQSMAVRRLTPRECERLQGFPDDYTKIPWKKRSADECPDGPRYKALGNSMAVPVMRWIGERIAKVEKV